MGVYRKLLHALDNHGPRGLLTRVLRKLARKPDTQPAFPEQDQPHPFDVLHGTDTGGFIPGEQLDGNSGAALYTTAYYGISPSSLTGALGLLPESPAGFSFVDLGCGKGRALLVAAAFPFAHILGVELSGPLCEIARANAAPEPRISVLQQDAATVTYPNGPLLVFLYHPFLKALLRRVLANLERQRRHSAHPTYVLYANCTYDKEMARSKFLTVAWDYSIPLSEEDAAADRHGTVKERYTLFQGDRV